MEKIPTLFQRLGSKVVDVVTPGCEWVIAGEGIATEKLDGTNVRLTVRSGEIVRVEKRRNPSKDQKARGIEPGTSPPRPARPSGTCARAVGWPWRAVAGRTRSSRGTCRRLKSINTCVFLIPQ